MGGFGILGVLCAAFWNDILTERGHGMAHAIIRGFNGRRHEADFGDAPVRVEVYAGEQVVEIFIESTDETAPSDKQPFALLNLPRHLFGEALGHAALRAGKQGIDAIPED
jgi:hypothetical protein